MDDLIVVSKKKYKYLQRAAIIMPILATVLVVALLVWVCGAFRELTADFVPNEGIWCCEELDLELDFDCELGDILTTADDEKYLIYCHNPTRSMSVRVIVNAVPIAEGGELRYEYEAGEEIYCFRHVRLEGNRYTVYGENGKQYVFTRK